MNARDALFIGPGTLEMRRRRARCRLEAALAVSGALHVSLAAALASTAPAKAFAPVPNVALSAKLLPAGERVKPQPLEAPQAHAVPGNRPGSTPAGEASGSDRAALPETLADAQERAEGGAALPQSEDPTYYSAHELDDYPQLLSPLRLDALPAEAPLFVELYIDEHGLVRRARLAEPRVAPEIGRSVIAALSAARFRPASREGRAVKSRLLLAFRPTAGRASEPPEASGFTRAQDAGPAAAAPTF